MRTLERVKRSEDNEQKDVTLAKCHVQAESIPFASKPCAVCGYDRGFGRASACAFCGATGSQRTA